MAGFISTLAASKLVAWHRWTGPPHEVLCVVTFALLALTFVGYVILCVSEIARVRLGYNIRRWATVFPLG
ncbi:hypothetical protein HLB23_36050 [Nocardia uniformis]|uniref:Uncharacterized protein n=1 Tax=Nocardia uniformis TaxID=53432 RepID=A0A849CEY4_9NOCA|nr:hypothetical protein [Nocardia uniformis]NNH75205.1 hypothetical protein [Nocardia uniformis]